MGYVYAYYVHPMYISTSKFRWNAQKRSVYLEREFR